MAAHTKQRRFLSQVETVRMAEVLKEHVIVTARDGDGKPTQCKYEEGWDDTRVAKEVHEDLTSNHSANLRSNLFGTLFLKKTDEKDERIEALEAKVTQLCSLLQEYSSKYDKLITALSLARVADVRHLAWNTPSLKPTTET